MKKSLIALAVAGAMTAPMVAQADATVYGNVEVEYVDQDSLTGGDQDADIQIDDARVGVKGSADLENLEGVQSFFQIEVEYNPSDAFSDGSSLSVRQTNAGIKGDFGRVVVGRFTNPAESTEGLDKYSESYSTDVMFLGEDRVGSAIAYISPNVGGFDGYVALVVDGENSSTADDADAYIVGANFAVAGLGLHAAYTEINGEYSKGGINTQVAGTPGAPDAELLQLSADYSISGVTVEAAYQDAEIGTAESDFWALGASYGMGNATIGATYMDFETELAGVTTEETDEWGVYASYKLGSKASVKAQYSSADVQKTASSFDVDAFVLGYNVAF